MPLSETFGTLTETWPLKLPAYADPEAVRLPVPSVSVTPGRVSVAWSRVTPSRTAPVPSRVRVRPRSACTVRPATVRSKPLTFTAILPAAVSTSTPTVALVARPMLLEFAETWAEKLPTRPPAPKLTVPLPWATVSRPPSEAPTSVRVRVLRTLPSAATARLIDIPPLRVTPPTVREALVVENANVGVAVVVSRLRVKTPLSRVAPGTESVTEPVSGLVARTPVGPTVRVPAPPARVRNGVPPARKVAPRLLTATESPPAARWVTVTSVVKDWPSTPRVRPVALTSPAVVAVKITATEPVPTGMVSVTAPMVL